MSRTYRRRGAEASHAYYFDESPRYTSWRQGPLVPWWVWKGYGELTEEQARKKRDAEFYSDGYRAMTTPMWWIREFMQVPLRAKERSLSRKLLLLEDLEDAPIFPHSRKPHIYYW